MKLFRDEERNITIEQHTIPTPYPVGPVHVYIIETEAGRVMIDTGPPGEESEKALTKALAGRSLDALLITHCHPDHHGLMPLIAQQMDIPILLCRYDIIMYEKMQERSEGLGTVLHHLGLPTVMVGKAREIMLSLHSATPLPRRAVSLEQAGEILNRFGISFTRCPGHSQSDVVYHIGNYTVTGDVLLRDIFQTPHVDVDLDTFEGRFGNYAAYCDTLVKLSGMRERVLLPGHREYIDSIDARITFYVSKVLERATAARPHLEAGMTPFEVLRILLPDVSGSFTVYMKLSEITFIRDFLRNPALLQDTLIASRMPDALVRSVAPFIPR